MLNLYSIFHLNPAYSAITVQDRARVIELCYWPLLQLVRSAKWPIGLEISAWGLEEIARHEPSWVEELKKLIDDSLVEFVGSGYCQIIGPLVPYRVNRRNFDLGWNLYGEFLGTRPELALLNEQAFSGGVADLLLDVGVGAVVMEWNNPRREHPEWEKTLLYSPQALKLPSGRTLKVLWNESVTFQKFQRFAHGDLEREEMVEWLLSHESMTDSRSLSLYGNDVEVFDFRPGRYMTEEPIHPDGEWERIRRLIADLRKQPAVSLVSPSEVLTSAQDEPSKAIDLQTARQPIPVKKQPKYNVVRWAVTGRDDFFVNSTCHQIAHAFAHPEAKPDDNDWRDLLELWSSDYRTHIGDARWRDFVLRLRNLAQEWGVPERASQKAWGVSKKSGLFRVEKKGRFLVVHGDRIRCELNLRRGLAVRNWIDNEVATIPLFGTIPIGQFEAVHMGADYFSGHLVFHPPGVHQITDLVPADPNVVEDEHQLFLSFNIESPLGTISKEVVIDDANGTLSVRHSIPVENQLGSLRFGFVSLLSDALGPEGMEYEAHLGGVNSESFSLEHSAVDHGSTVSNLISASNGVGATEGWMSIHDRRKGVRVSLHEDSRGALGFVKSERWNGQPLDYMCFSAMELDDTSRPSEQQKLNFGVDISAHRVT